MSVPLHVKRTIDVLCAFYGDRDGAPRKLNSVQVTVYTEGLAPLEPTVLEHAARRWMKQSKFFPALSELLELISPKVDVNDLALEAWARLGREIPRIGAYRSVQFSDPAFGLAVRETFGSWPAACAIDPDSPAWAIRRQTFIAVFKSAARREHVDQPVVLGGLHGDQTPALIGPLDGGPALPALSAASEPARALRSA